MGNVRYVGVSEIQGNHAPEINESRWRFLAQGDSWFSIGGSFFGLGSPTPLPLNGSLLLSMQTTDSSIVVSAAYPGKTLEQMVNPRQEIYFKRLLSGNLAHQFDAILLSGSGNDFIDAAGIDPNTTDPDQISRRILRKPGEWLADTNAPQKYVFQEGWDSLLARLLSYYRTLIAWRDGTPGESASLYPNRGLPIFTHAYDYAQPRPSPVLVGVHKLGPWLWAPFIAHAIPQTDHDALVRWFLDSLATFQRDLNTNLGASANIRPMNLHGQLTLASFEATGISNDWENEIHPTAGGYSKLADAFVTQMMPGLGNARA
jgi:hypothetical protein